MTNDNDNYIYPIGSVWITKDEFDKNIKSSVTDLTSLQRMVVEQAFEVLSHNPDFNGKLCLDCLPSDQDLLSTINTWALVVANDTRASTDQQL